MHITEQQLADLLVRLDAQDEHIARQDRAILDLAKGFMHMSTATQNALTKLAAVEERVTRIASAHQTDAEARLQQDETDAASIEATADRINAVLDTIDPPAATAATAAIAG